ncbi:MAG: hypothetical protein VR68_13020 [Peptococcaceae bacterium BRH_c4a]|nr:MAG: hypothetical protein VR68_13020 [Peptococcaceae bacterium BRH_c4a]
MRKKILVVDTSFLCCWLGVPGKETCGKHDDVWDMARVIGLIDEEIEAGATLILPLATIIETGNHIAQAPHSQYELAKKLGEIMIKTADEESPWGAFTTQGELWENEGLKNLAHEWPELAVQKLTLGDASIKTVAEFYAKADFIIEILTGDEGLKAYQPTYVVHVPRRRKNR